MHDRARSTSCAARTAAGGSSSSTSLFHRTNGDEIHDGILGCQCCIFPVVDGIPVLHLQPAADGRARAHRSRAAGRWRCARCSASTTTAQAERVRSGRVVRRGRPIASIVEALGPNFEGGYFLYRFSDPDLHRRATPSSARWPARCSAAAARDRHLRRLGPPDAVAAWTCRRRRRCSPTCIFAKIWLARRFTAPGCEPVCCDGNAPMPFARGAFGFAMCSDAFMYIWTKRQFVGEMTRLVDGAGEPGAVRHQPHAQPAARGARRTASRCRRTATAICSRRSSRAIFGEAGLFADVVERRPARPVAPRRRTTLDADPALTIVASRAPGVFAPHRARRRRRRRAASSGSTRSTSVAPRDGERTAAAPAFPVRRLRGGVRRLPAVPARGGRRSTARALAALADGPRAGRAGRPGRAGGSSSTCRSGTTRSEAQAQD